MTVSVTCTNGGTPAPASGTVSHAAPRTYTITGFTAGATCTATETVPAGYTVNQAGCAGVPIVIGGTASCTITNTLNSATLTVNKNFSDNSSASVTVSVTCTNGGTPAPASGTVSHAAPRTYTITGFTAGATCTATETVPAGYTESDNCANVAITVGGTPSCTITNTLNSATLTVNKNFSDNSAASVTVSVTCTNGGTPAPASGTVSRTAPRTFTITGFTAGATCTATETVPAGYTANQAACAGVAITNGGTPSCTITNTLNSATLTVNKNFSDNSAALVTVSVTCTNGGTPAPASGTVSHAAPRTFTITGFTAGATCTATETVPAGYTANQAACAGVAIINGGTPSCTITNTLNSATLTVNKNFSDNSAASVTVSVTCTNGGTPAPASGTVSHAAPRTFTITGFTTGATCTATETVPAGYTANQAGCANVAITTAARLPARSPTRSTAPPSPSTRTSPTTAQPWSRSP